MNDALYRANEAAANAALTAADVATLQQEEAGWLVQSNDSLSEPTLTEAQTEWTAWVSGHTPGYRLLAMADNFGGDVAAVPGVLDVAIGWLPAEADAPLKAIFEKVAAISTGSSASGSVVGLSGVGILLLAGVAFFLLKGGRK